MGQRGQALVAVLVVMTLLFLMAGAVAVGASALLDRQRQQERTQSRAFTERSAVAAAVAWAQAGGCVSRAASPAPIPSPSPSILPPLPPADSPIPTPPESIPLPESSPSPTPTPDAVGPAPGRLLILPGGVQVMAYCLHLNGVAGLPTQVRLGWPGGADCVSTGLPASGPSWVFFDARWQGRGEVWVDEEAEPDSCRPPSTAACATRVVAPADTVMVVPVALSCNLSGLDTPVLHVADVARSPGLVFVASQSTSGVLELLAVGTGTPGAYDQVVLTMQGHRTALRYWAPL